MSKSETRIIINSYNNTHAISETALKLQEFVTKELKLRIEWLRKFLPTIGADTHPVILSEIFKYIIGDDENCFGFEYESQSPAMLRLGKHNLITRMSVEIATPETPSVIRRQLQKTMKTLSAFDWMEQEKYEKAKYLWRTNVRDFTNNKTRYYALFDEAINYTRVYQPQITQGWGDYLASRVIKQSR